MGPAKPSMRSIIGITVILCLIAAWAVLVASVGRIVGAWPVFAQTAFYLVTGLLWILPLKPLVRWIVTGSFRGPGAGTDLN